MAVDTLRPRGVRKAWAGAGHHRAMDEGRTRRALERCVDAMLRMVHGLRAEHGLEPITDDEYNEAIATAAEVLYGPERTQWQTPVRDAAEGRYE